MPLLLQGSQGNLMYAVGMLPSLCFLSSFFQSVLSSASAATAETTLETTETTTANKMISKPPARTINMISYLSSFLVKRTNDA